VAAMLSNMGEFVRLRHFCAWNDYSQPHGCTQIVNGPAPGGDYNVMSSDKNPLHTPLKRRSVLKAGAASAAVGAAPMMQSST